MYQLVSYMPGLTTNIQHLVMIFQKNVKITNVRYLRILVNQGDLRNFAFLSWILLVLCRISVIKIG